MKASKLNEAAALAAKKAADATAAAELAQHEALEAKAAFDAEAEERRLAFMKAWLAEFDDDALDTEQRAAMAAFEEAAQADPLAKAWLDVLRMYVRRYQDGLMAQNFSTIIGAPVPPPPAGGSPPQVAEALQLAVYHLAERLEGERVAEVWAALEAAAGGDDDGT